MSGINAEPDMTKGAPPEKKHRIKTSTLLILLLFIPLILYLSCDLTARWKFNKVYSRTEEIKNEILPIFSSKVDDPGNGGQYLYAISSPPGSQDLARDLIYPKKSPEETSAIVQAWMKNNAGYEQNFKKLMEYSVFAYERNFKFDQTLPELAAIRNFYRVSGFLMVEFAKQKKFDEFLSVVKGADHVLSNYEGPLLISALVKLACESIFTTRLCESLEYIDSADVLEKLLSLLHHESPFSTEYMRFAYKFESCSVAENLKRLTFLELVSSMSMYDYEEDYKMVIRQFVFKYFPPYTLTVKTEVIEWIIGLADMIDKTPAEISKAYMQYKDEKDDQNILIANLKSVYFRSMEEWIRARCKRNLLIAVIRVHRYYIANGKLPETLEDIPFYKKHGLPEDPRNNVPLKYKIFTDPLCFRIKTLGPDGVDSGTWLKPELDPKYKNLGIYKAVDYGWHDDIEETVFGVNYFKNPPIPQEKKTTGKPLKKRK